MSNQSRSECAWCRKVLRDGPADNVSHDICPACMATYFPGLKLDGAKDR
jgi:hypothetical protein